MSKARSLVLLLLGLSLALLLLFAAQSTTPGQEKLLRIELAGSIDFDRLFSEITAESVGRTHRRILRFPSRLAGTAGDLEVADEVEQEFRHLKMDEVLVQRYPVTIPVTKWCRLSDREGREVTGVSLVPFWPNHVRTCTTLPEGIVGRVIDVGTGTFEELDGKPIRDNIALVRMTPGFAWLAAAKLGVKAVLFRATTNPDDYMKKILHFPGDMPRFLTTGPAVEDLVGKEVRIQARVDWEVRTARNVYGVLRPKVETKEALVLMGFTDSWSVVPDLAPGAYEACSVTALLEAARAMAAQRENLVRGAIFVACSGRGLGVEGPRRMIDALGLRDDFAGNYKLLQKRLAESEAAHSAMERAVASVKALMDVDYWQLDEEGEKNLWSRGSPPYQAFTSVVGGLIDRYVAVVEHESAMARLAWREGGRPEAGPTMESQLAAARRLRRARTAVGVDGWALKEYFADVLDASGCRPRLDAALTAALATAGARHGYDRDVLRVADMFKPFKTMYHYILAPSTRGRRLGFQGRVGGLDRARDAVLARWLEWKGLYQDAAAVENPSSIDRAVVISRHMVHSPVGGEWWMHEGYLRTFPVEKEHKFALWHIGTVFENALHANVRMVGLDLPETYQTPLDLAVQVGDLVTQTQLLTALAIQMVAGEQSMVLARPYAWRPRRWFSDVGGTVVTAGAANSILPNRRVADAVVVVKGTLGRFFHIQKTSNGVFRMPAVANPGTLIADAYTLDEATGQVTAARDMGQEGMAYPYEIGERMHYEVTETRITLLLSRMAPTDFYQLIGPDVQPVTPEVMEGRFNSPATQFSVTHAWDEGATVFVKPGERFFVQLLNYPHYRYFGREGQFSKSFLRGFGPDTSLAISPESLGPGYLAGVDHRAVFQEVDAAMSVAVENRDRLEAQMRTGLANPVSVQRTAEADRLVKSGLEALGHMQYTRAYRDLSQSAALSMQAHPTVKAAVADAVSGILLYLCLLVPFSVFAERLLIGVSDIRMRIGGTFGIFLLVFTIIRYTHPAYDLVIMPMIILVGFVILMLSVLILIFISGRFAQRMGQWRRAGGGATEADADISRAAAAATAFNLGINNMRKRKVRTGYTIGTLVLVSFCLVCFTAPNPQLLERELVVGPAPYNGVLLTFERQAAGYLSAIKARYGDRAHVFARRSGQKYWSMEYTPPGSKRRTIVVRGALYVQKEEAQLTDIRKLLLPGGRWFDRNDENVCYLSDVMAVQLGIDPRSLAEEKVEVMLAGWPVRVAGIFHSAGLDVLRGINGETMMPEIEGAFSGREQVEQRTIKAAGRPGAKKVRATQVLGARMVIMPLDPAREILCSSVVLLFKDVPYATMRETINSIMDSAPTFVSYALDGLAFFGGKFRFIGLEGLVDVAVPLLVGSFLVFNTLLGSVYERQSEIAVYSAVGLSPRHVFYLFLAESLVYAVIGVMGGYLLALCLQWVSHQSGDLLHLSINHSSRSAVYVMLTLMGTVVVSSVVPARRAAQIASPAEKLATVPPETDAGKLEFELPFTYRGRDVLSVVPFLSAWFDVRSEDSSGEFRASSPRVRVEWNDDGESPTITISATTWLRPYDLGVSQRVRISVQPSGEANVYVACIRTQMQSGDVVSWRRTNARFIGLLRHHLLRWRALSARRKELLCDQGANMLDRRAGLGGSTV